MKIAVPWNLGHYMPAGGFSPMYRALFDHVPDGIEICAWDNYRLSRFLGKKPRIAKALARTAIKRNNQFGNGIDTPWGEENPGPLWAANQVLTHLLPGDIEFHHTVPFPSFSRPFVFHCEYFDSISEAVVRSGLGGCGSEEEIREKLRAVFTHRLCMGIFSHLPETLNAFGRYFSDPAIDARLRLSRIAPSSSLPVESVSFFPIGKRPVFLFFDSGREGRDGFFSGGGHIALRFWKMFREGGGQGVMIMHGAKPSLDELLRRGASRTFLEREEGQSIIWSQDHLTSAETNRLISRSHFFLRPGRKVETMELLQAIGSGTIPIVSDTGGITHAIGSLAREFVLEKKRGKKHHADGPEQIATEMDRENSWIDDSQLSRLAGRTREILDRPENYLAMRETIRLRAREIFSGEVFASEFWNCVISLSSHCGESSFPKGPLSRKMTHALKKCLLRKEDVSAMFECSWKPVPRIQTGRTSVWELGGMFFHLPGGKGMNPDYFSALAPFLMPDVPEIAISRTIAELQGAFLLNPELRENNGLGFKFVKAVSSLVIPYPRPYRAIRTVCQTGLKAARFVKRALEK